ncbi:MAG: futalosine hydrolase [Vulcanimicrobiaceae bacterium]
MILVVCALPQELRDLDVRAYDPARVGVLACGVGPVEAAIATARALAARRYDAVVNAGIGGAFPGRARVGDALALASDTFADLGLEGGGELALPPGTLVDEARADAELLERLAGGPLPVVTGVTVGAVTATVATAERLAARYGATVESMEGFAVLRAATLAGVPAVEVRGISNYVGERARSAWDFAAGTRATARALAFVLERLIAHPS